MPDFLVTVTPNGPEVSVAGVDVPTRAISNVVIAMDAEGRSAVELYLASDLSGPDLVALDNGEVTVVRPQEAVTTWLEGLDRGELRKAAASGGFSRSPADVILDHLIDLARTGAR